MPGYYAATESATGSPLPEHTCVRSAPAENNLPQSGQGYGGGPQTDQCSLALRHSRRLITRLQRGQVTDAAGRPVPAPRRLRFRFPQAPARLLSSSFVNGHKQHGVLSNVPLTSVIASLLFNSFLQTGHVNIRLRLTLKIVNPPVHPCTGGLILQCGSQPCFVSDSC